MCSHEVTGFGSLRSCRGSLEAAAVWGCYHPAAASSPSPCWTNRQNRESLYVPFEDLWSLDPWSCREWKSYVQFKTNWWDLLQLESFIMQQSDDGSLGGRRSVDQLFGTWTWDPKKIKNKVFVAILLLLIKKKWLSMSTTLTLSLYSASKLLDFFFFPLIP